MDDNILMMKLNRNALDLTQTKSLVERIEVDKPTNDLVFYLDSSTNLSNAHPSFLKLVDKINHSIEMNSIRQKLEIDEKKIQISILEEDKNFKLESNKYELMEKALELKKKTNDYEYTSKLKEMILEAIQNSDFHKASYLNLCLNKSHSEAFNSYLNCNATSSNYATVTSNQLNDLTHANMNHNMSDDESINEDTTSNNTNLAYNTNGPELGEVMNIMANDEINTNLIDENDDVENDLEAKNLIDKFNFKTNTPPMYKLSLANKNIRHLICSTSKLEDYCNSSALTILYKGKCHESEICHRKESHTHYLIDCTNCRRHISLYFQTSKYGLKFYKTYQIKSQAELDKIIRTFRMRLVRECM